MSTLAAAVAVLAFVNPGQAHRSQSRPQCRTLFTVAMTEHVSRTIFAGTRPVRLNDFRRLGRMEMCQRNPSAQAFVRRYDRHQRKLWSDRRAAPEWAIPAPIVLCESGGQNLSPNSAGASGYYQIIPGTWSAYGGAGSDAYLAAKSEQDAVASRIWAGGSGASQWVCSGLTGY